MLWTICSIKFVTAFFLPVWCSVPHREWTDCRLPHMPLLKFILQKPLSQRSGEDTLQCGHEAVAFFRRDIVIGSACLTANVFFAVYKCSCHLIQYEKITGFRKFFRISESSFLFMVVPFRFFCFLLFLFAAGFIVFGIFPMPERFLQ